MKLDGLLLAGGRSRRFGADKRVVRMGGETLVGRALFKLRQAAGGGIFVATGARRERLAGLEAAMVVRDAPPGCGPLGGIAAGLLRTRVGILVLACDLPWVRVATLIRLGRIGARLDRPVAIHGPRGWEPLVAYYPPWVLHDVQAALSLKVLAPHGLLDRLDAVPVYRSDTAEFSNVNRPGDLASRSPLAG